MYIVNQANNEIVEVKSVKMYFRYSEKNQKDSSEIHTGIKCKVYNYGSSEDCYNALKDSQKQCVDKIKEYRISVNDKDFATYSTEAKAILEFNAIKDSIMEGRVIHILE